jgi:hypothetical protein
LFVAILGLKIPHRLCFLHPWIPNYHILEIVSDDLKNLLSTFADDNWLIRALGRCVDTVSLSSDGDDSIGFCLRGLGDFVYVFAAVEAGNGNLSNILYVPLKLLSMFIFVQHRNIPECANKYASTLGSPMLHYLRS